MGCPAPSGKCADRSTQQETRHVVHRRFHDCGSHCHQADVIEHARHFDTLFIELGATHVIEGRGDNMPDGKVTDPRTPHEREKKGDFDRVERLAGFTREEMKQKLELKKEGKCSCGAKDIRCKTMCGTTLGPDAKEPDPKNRILHKND